MRIAAVQMRVSPTSRSATLQSALRGIDAAAARDPAPDLVVLPAFLETCLEGDTGSIERVHGAGVAACARRARSWGVSVCFGMVARGSPRTSLTGILLDHDGDARLVCGAPCEAPVEAAESVKPARDVVAHTVVGRIGLLTGEDVLIDSAWQCIIAGRAQVAVAPTCLPADRAAKVAASAVRFAKQHACCCVIADITTGSDGSYPGCSCVIDASGAIVASLPAGEEGLLFFEVPISSTDAASPVTE